MASFCSHQCLELPLNSKPECLCGKSSLKTCLFCSPILLVCIWQLISQCISFMWSCEGGCSLLAGVLCFCLLLWLLFIWKKWPIKEKGDSRKCTDLCYVWFSWFRFSAFWRGLIQMVLEITGSSGDKWGWDPLESPAHAVVLLGMRSDCLQPGPEQGVVDVGSLQSAELTLQTKSHPDWPSEHLETETSEFLSFQDHNIVI